jgi:hypothetical protein
MRRLSIAAALSLLLALPVSSTAGRGPSGAGTLSVRNGRGEIVLQIKGAVLGRLAVGRLTVTDNDPYDEQQPEIYGAIHPKPRPLSDSTTVYKGRHLRFRVLEGTYRLRLEGKGIHLSAVGRGWVVLDGDDRFERNGVYSLNGDQYEPIPWDRTPKLKIQESSEPPGKPGSGPGVILGP